MSFGLYHCPGKLSANGQSIPGAYIDDLHCHIPLCHLHLQHISKEAARKQFGISDCIHSIGSSGISRVADSQCCQELLVYHIMWQNYHSIVLQKMLLHPPTTCSTLTGHEHQSTDLGALRCTVFTSLHQATQQLIAQLSVRHHCNGHPAVQVQAPEMLDSTR